jgi:hypothetical protein
MGGESPHSLFCRCLFSIRFRANSPLVLRLKKRHPERSRSRTLRTAQSKDPEEARVAHTSCPFQARIKAFKTSLSKAACTRPINTTQPVIRRKAKNPVFRFCCLFFRPLHQLRIFPWTRHLDRSCSQSHREQRSGEIPAFAFCCCLFLNRSICEDLR